MKQLTHNLSFGFNVIAMSVELKIQQFNRLLVEKEVPVALRDYITHINESIFHEPIHEFMDDLLCLVVSKTCCIPHEKLVTYGVLAANNASGNCGALMKQWAFLPGIDYIVEQIPTSSKGLPRSIYKLTPRAFELCLMRSKNTRKYAKFYSLLRECVYSYKEYQAAFEHHKLMQEKRKTEQLTKKNSNLERIIAEIRATSAKTDKKIDTVLEINEEILTGVKAIKGQLDTVTAVANDELDQQCAVADAQVAAAHDTVTPPERPSDADSILLMHLCDKKYMACRVQAKAAAKTLSKHVSRYPRIREVIHLTDVPNGKYLWKHCRDTLKGRIKMVGISPTTFTLEGDTTEQEVTDLLRALYDRPTQQAKLAGAAIKARVNASRSKISQANTTAGRVLTRVTTTTVTETLNFSEQDLAALEDLLG